ncbi:MAG: cation:dicarboxylase symporter family transporter [Lachnospiraceae bacterium]|nr:cation:dicarboxylase symporter family transporter [Lachnospiraceae bacterium]
MNEKQKLPLATQIFIALILGIIAGLLLQNHAEIPDTYIKPIGTIFLNLLKFIVVPIVLFSLMAGIVSMSDIRKVGSIGLKVVIYYMCTTAVAIVIGLPLDGIALVAGVDRIFDMGRTVVNITGDASCALVVSNLERKKALKKKQA